MQSVIKEIQKTTNFPFEVKGCTTEHFINVGLCIECNNCELGCAARHGHRRLNRQNYQQHSPSEIIPRTCKQCYERSCVKACAFGAMRIDKDSEIVLVADSCVGCSLCVEACPHKAITMEERTVTHKIEERNAKRKMWPTWFSDKKVETHTYANKCDLCLGYNDLACVNQCPTGALRLRVVNRKGDFKKEFADDKGEKGEGDSVTEGSKKPILKESDCVKCSLCVKKCPAQVISMEPYPVIKDECLSCGLCVKVCPKKALEMEKPLQKANSVDDNKNSVSPNDKTTQTYNINSKGRTPISIHIDIKLDSQMTEERLRGLLALLKTELLEEKQCKFSKELVL